MMSSRQFQYANSLTAYLDFIIFLSASLNTLPILLGREANIYDLYFEKG